MKNSNLPPEVVEELDASTEETAQVGKVRKVAKSASPAASASKSGGNDFSAARDVAARLNKKMGREVIRFGDGIPEIVKVPLNEPAIDFCCDGGIPLGRFSEFLGDQHSGKTRAAIRAMAKFQKFCFGCRTPNTLTVKWTADKSGFPVVASCTCSECNDPETKVNVFIDAEGTTDRKFLRRLGVDTAGIIYMRPDLPSDAVDAMEAYLQTPGIGLIILDSFGVMSGNKEVNNPIGDINMNQNAVFFNMAFRKWQAAMNKAFNLNGGKDEVAAIIINQSYVTLSIYSSEVAQGGRGLRHGKGVSVKFKVLEKAKDKKGEEETLLGVQVRVENLKNKTGMPYRKAEFFLNLDPNNKEIAYGHTNELSQYVDLAVRYKIVEQSGTWYTLAGHRCQGKAGLLDILQNHPEVVDVIDKELYG